MATPNPLSLLGFGKKPAPASAHAEDRGQDAGEQQAPTPAFSVVRGNPTEEELAALTSVVVALQAQADSQQETALEIWQRRLNHTQRLGMRLRPGPGSWKRARPQ
ncbi:acyl-CoA carboxylase subunit epsilon [Rothia sp. SD9660Na]|uniref:acyl-CoA carboxylase subunit epsilon n=1 Tax=Rothia sp. SD9660Na TaxID=3047030 RepID=UPI0024B9E494|nr:acyl-CoA carboxylase subunit epsilon [Rothia sp. SD9660Na]WHS49979.1 acyl-CoA carboxylase subunit epsilon [Rothia sp. SD9660Na]